MFSWVDWWPLQAPEWNHPESWSFIPENDPRIKHLLIKITTGDTMNNDSWFEPLQQQTQLPDTEASDAIPDVKHLMWKLDHLV